MFLKPHHMPSAKLCGIFLHIVDNFLCLFVFFPSMVLYWRGIWDLWGVYIFPGQYPKQQWVLLNISLTSMFGYFIAPMLDKYLDRNNRKLYIVASRTYSFVYAALYMCYWKAVWELADFYMPVNRVSAAVNLTCTYVLLLVFRVSRCCIFPPMFTLLDTRDDFFKVSTCFGAEPFTTLFVADTLFSHIFIIGLTILSWRGMWNFQGSFILHNNAPMSNLFCLGLGYVLIISLFILEEPLASMTLWMGKQGFYYKLVLEDTIYAVTFFCTAILWRGGWNVTANYIIPDPQMGGWICFILGTALLMALQLFSFVSAHGVAVDGKDSGRAAIFPTKYLRIYWDTFNAKTAQSKEETNHTENAPPEGDLAVISSFVNRSFSN